MSPPAETAPTPSPPAAPSQDSTTAETAPPPAPPTARSQDSTTAGPSSPSRSSPSRSSPSPPPSPSPPSSDREDRAALVATLAGGVVAAVGWRDPVTLVGGLALGVGGVLLALRPRPTPPTPGASLLGGLLALLVAAALVRGALSLVEGWAIGQLFAEGAGLDAITATGRRYGLALRLLRDGSLVASGLYLGLAALRRRARSPSPGASGSPGAAAATDLRSGDADRPSPPPPPTAGR